jgi:hypothetical protein
MKLILAAAALAFAALPVAAAAQGAPPPAVAASAQAAVDELLAADRGFAAAAADVDVVTALSAMFADDLRMAIPPGRFARSKAEAVAALRANPANAASRTRWAPLRGGISADGSHGFTFGYMTTTQPGQPDRPGKYLSYWVKTPAGWRVVAYRRAGRPAGAVSTAMLPPSLPAAGPAPGGAAAAGDAAAAIAAAERAFAAEAQVVGLRAAFTNWGHADAANIGQGPGFTIGAAAIGAEMGPEPTSPLDWGPDEGVLAAPGGDLGVSFGHLRPKQKPPAGQPDRAPFFTVWKRDATEAWRYIAE